MRHNEFKAKIKSLDLNLKDFSKLVNISYSTISKYGKSNPIPEWVEPFLRIYEENKNMENIKEEIKSLAKKL